MLVMLLLPVTQANAAGEKTQVTPTPFGMLMQTLYDGHLRIILDFGEETTTDLTGSNFTFSTALNNVSIELLAAGTLRIKGTENIWKREIISHCYWNLANGKLRIEVPWEKLNLTGESFLQTVFVPSRPLEF